MKKINILVALIAMNSVDIFFTINAVLGQSYSGESTVYNIYNIFVFVSNVLFFFFLMRSKIEFKKIIYIFFFICYIYVSFGIQYLGQTITDYGITVFAYVNIWTLTSIIAAYMISRINVNKILYFYSELLIILITVAIIFSAIIPKFSGINVITYGGATYQTLSYLAALAYGLNFYFLFDGRAYLLGNKIFENKVYIFLRYIMLGIQLMGVILSGGRGGMILIIIYTLYSLKNLFKSKKYKKIFFFTIISIGLFLLVWPALKEIEVITSGLTRVFEFISPTGGINWEGTSNRGSAYMDALEIFYEKPLLGHGIFSVNGYSHNIILDLLIHFGIIGFLIIIFLFIPLLVIKYKRIFRMNNDNTIIVIWLFYPLVMLLFSGSYLYNSTLWFFVFIIIFHNTKIGANQ